MTGLVVFEYRTSMSAHVLIVTTKHCILRHLSSEALQRVEKFFFFFLFPPVLCPVSKPYAELPGLCFTSICSYCGMGRYLMFIMISVRQEVKDDHTQRKPSTNLAPAHGSMNDQHTTQEHGLLLPPTPQTGSGLPQFNSGVPCCRKDKSDISMFRPAQFSFSNRGKLHFCLILLKTSFWRG